MDIIDNISNNIDTSNGIVGEDGLLRCKVCGEKLQKEVEFLGRKRIVNLSCSCRIKEREQRAAEERKRQIESNRDICFDNPNMRNWSFDNDDGNNPRISNAMKKYCEHFPGFLKSGKGLLLYGDLGTGKTYYASCIANQLINDGYRCRMTNFPTLINKIQATFEHRQEVMDEINRYSLLIIDDLGVERNSQFMLENVYNIIDSRYRIGKPIIITTNLTGEQLKNPGDVGFARIYDRILAMCHPIKFEGKSRRAKGLSNEFIRTNQILGL